MTELDQQRIAEWIGDAFAILCVRVGGISKAEINLRLGFEDILRQLGTPPLRIISTSLPPLSRVPATTADLRLIRKALDSCLAVFQRYERVLNAEQRRTQALVAAARDCAAEELRAREMREPSAGKPTLIAA